MALIEIDGLPIKNGGSFHSFLYVYQRVTPSTRSSVFTKAQPFDVLQRRIEHMLRQQLGGIKSDHASIVKGLKKRADNFFWPFNWTGSNCKHQMI